MSLGTLASKAPSALVVEADAPTLEEAAGRLMKAVHGNDVAGVADALRMAHAACEDEADAAGEEG